MSFKNTSREVGVIFPNFFIQTTNLGSIQIVTLGGSTVYLILLSSTLLQSLSLSCRNLSIMIFLLTRSGSDILSIHCRSLPACEAEWSMRCRFQRCFQINSSSMTFALIFVKIAFLNYE